MKRPQDIRVLVVEDDYLVSEMAKCLLQKNGYVVAGEASDGFEAVKLTERLRPDVILMDIKMPRLDGLEAARRICVSCPTPIVILTAYDTTAELVEEATEAGASAFLTKPPGARDLEQAIATALADFAA
jgi:response regulator NasT